MIFLVESNFVFNIEGIIILQWLYNLHLFNILKIDVKIIKNNRVYIIKENFGFDSSCTWPYMKKISKMSSDAAFQLWFSSVIKKPLSSFDNYINSYLWYFGFQLKKKKYTLYRIKIKTNTFKFIATTITLHTFYYSTTWWTRV